MLVFVRGVGAVCVYDQPGDEATLVKQMRAPELLCYSCQGPFGVSSGFFRTRGKVISRDYVRGRGLRDVWASDATLIVRAWVQRRLDLRCYWCGRVASCVFMLELNFHSGSSIYSNETDEHE
ncbi:hypothetical protein DY000_02032416 [Brassica cretica]|uniref:Yippee domain-containing protein n=1 Tax=Brassica cretica TaxID=69181 RepID=A0ABQ7DPZ6_BRACR|nr:hypothetical protein DY000_02032416 [Brassica cretica]